VTFVTATTAQMGLCGVFRTYSSVSQRSLWVQFFVVIKRCDLVLGEILSLFDNWSTRLKFY